MSEIGDDDDSDVIIPDLPPGSAAPSVVRTPAAFGSPEFESPERGPFKPPEPGVLPNKSALKRGSRQPTINMTSPPPLVSGAPPPMIVPAGTPGVGGQFGSPSRSPMPMGLEPGGVQAQPQVVPTPAMGMGMGIPPLGSPEPVIPPLPAGMSAAAFGQPHPGMPMMQQPQIPPQGMPPQFLHPQQMQGMPTGGSRAGGSFVHPGATPMMATPGMIPGPTPGSMKRRATMPTPMVTPGGGFAMMPPNGMVPPNGMMPNGMMPNGMMPNGMPHGMPMPGVHPQQPVYPPYGTLPRGAPHSSSRHRRPDGRRHASMDHHHHHHHHAFDPDESDSEEDEEDDDDGVHPRVVPVGGSHQGHSQRRHNHHKSGRNPLPNPPRSIPVPVIPQQQEQQQLSADGSILVNSPPDQRPPSPVKIPPNPLPTPPKDIKVENNALSAELAAAADAVKRAREGTELARNKVIARYEADAWRAAGVPIMEDKDASGEVDKEKDPQVPLIPGVTGPSVLGSKSRGGTLKDKERKGRQKEYVLGNVKTDRRGSKSRSRSRVRVQDAKRGDSDYDDSEGEEERGKEKDSDEQPHTSLAAGFTSLLKRMSTKRANNPPPVAPKPANRGSRQAPPRPPPPAMHNSFDMPEEEGIHPRSVKRTPTANINGSMANRMGPIVNGQQFAFAPNSGAAQGGMQMPVFDPQTGEYYDPVSGNWWNPNTRKYYQHRAVTGGGGRKDEEEEKEGPGRGFVRMIKRWTTMTAPDDQPKPITTKLVFGRPSGTAAAGVNGMANGNGRRSHQQPRGVSILPDHPHQPTAGGSRHTRARTMSTGAGERSRTPWPGAGPAFSANGNQSVFFSPNGAVPGTAATWAPQSAAARGGLPGQAPARVYFSRLKDPYGSFRLDSDHPVQWGGVEAPTALHWLESGKFERVRTGLGALGMETGWTRPSLQPRAKSSSGMKGKLKGLLGGLKGGSSASLGDGIKKARLEFASARTEESDAVLRARSLKEMNHIVAEFTLGGRLRADWNRIWEDKLEEIVYLKVMQHEDVMELLLQTQDADIVFNSADMIFGDGQGNGHNKLGQALMRVRDKLYMIRPDM